MEQDETTRARCDALHEQIVAAMKELIKLHQCDRIAIPIDGSVPQLYIATGTPQDMVHHGRLLSKDAAHAKKPAHAHSPAPARAARG